MKRQYGCLDRKAVIHDSKVRGLVAKVRELNPEIRFDYCFIHREIIFPDTAVFFFHEFI
jgi:hypothetical protein